MAGKKKSKKALVAGPPEPGDAVAAYQYVRTLREDATSDMKAWSAAIGHVEQAADLQPSGGSYYLAVRGPQLLSACRCSSWSGSP